ncbi:MAG: carboxynorspermidine decarboxylase [Gammaproteobacteria bacterium]|uniref:carboxynorspermidine decarboxylase n=1 Tax=Methylotuvimicrobium sp. TaxID=2822413 RepID=UPI001D22FBFE|nr:carboxynorspermidine decarboxylase [Gammaproteobacteria bacterium]
MSWTQLKEQLAETPAFVYDLDAIESTLQTLSNLRDRSGCKVLYSVKSLPLLPILHMMRPYLDGFSVSSLFEARLASEVLAGNGSVHLTTPGIRADEVEELTRICSHVSCNSYRQLDLFTKYWEQGASVGLRLNPKLSFLDDRRYDPCRPYSKLGIDLEGLDMNALSGRIKGLHFHNIFSASDFDPLVQTLTAIRNRLGNVFSRLEWLNLGGGYLYDQIGQFDIFIDSVKQLRKEFGLEVLIEPGKALVGRAGYLATSVVDCFVSDGKSIAVLDTSVNHHPEVFEYQWHPPLLEHCPNGRYSAILAGSTCLAGDIFGEYRFDRPLQEGDRLVFSDAGAYALVKAHRFNGYNLPDIYGMTSGNVFLLKRHTYQHYYDQWSGLAPT